jgi:filamentous hemagglutinin family protein
MYIGENGDGVMKVNFAGFGLISGILVYGIYSTSVNAQVIPDATLKTSVSQSGNNFTITNGDRVGNNLFHSFSQFSIPSQGSAFFNNASDIQNIFSRVTGSNISNIDGLIQANGSANLFLLNPNGIIFGQNAKLDIGGSFLGSTASNIKFADGVEFSATNPSATPLLTMSVPIGLQMGTNPGDIMVNGSGYSFSRLSNSAVRITSTSNLQVKPGKTLALLGGNITMAGSRVSTNSGIIELGSVSEGSIDFNSTVAGWEFGYKKASRFGDMKLDQAIVDAIVPGGGSINLQARNIVLNNGSSVVIQNQGSKLSGGININASESLKVTGSHPKQSYYSDIRTESLLGSTKDISISTQRLILSSREGINSAALNAPGGNIIINASESIQLLPDPLNPRFTSQIESTSFANGKGGNIIISTGNLIILDGSQVSSITRSKGNSGNITIDAKSIEVNGIRSDLTPSLISAGSLAQGNAGDLLINTNRLTISGGGRVDSSTLAQGNAGSVSINAKEFIEVSGTVPGSINPSLIISSANLLDESLRRDLRLPPIPTGKSGNLIINTPVLKVLDGAQITVKNDGTGNAGDLKVNANSIFLDSKGSITAATKSREGGNITINLQDLLIMRRGSVLSTESLSTGNGGNITINSPIIVGSKNSDIIANAVKGNGGNIDITTQGIFGLQFRNSPTPENDITASSQFGVNGTVQINNIGVDPNSGLIELPENVTDQSQQIASGCSANQGSSFVATGRGGIPQNPSQEVRSDRPWSDIRDISAYRKTQSVQAQIPKSSETLVQATGWYRNARGKIELVADKSSTQGQQPLTCAAISQN